MLFANLQKIWENIDYPFFQHSNGENLFFNQLSKIDVKGLNYIQKGDVVTLIGDFDPYSITTLLRLLELGAIVVPLTSETSEQHPYFFKESFSQYIFEKNKLVKSISKIQKKHLLIDRLRDLGNPGLILFTTGTTGRPKAIIHDFDPFISRYKTPRPPLKALSFLLFDHIGGINTLFHMLFNQGQIVSIKERTVKKVFDSMNKYSIELLPTTPTFLRMVSLYPGIEKRFPESLKIISYGTERMDQHTLDRLCNQFPKVDFRQTYGTSELGILRVKSKSRNSLYMKLSGEGVETKVIENILYIKSKNRMLGYLNADSPFDSNGWYCTKDVVKENNGGFLKIIGRDTDIINVGGLKFMPSEVELECLKIPQVNHAKAKGRFNPITGQHLELFLDINNSEDSINLKKIILSELRKKLPKHMIPSRIRFTKLKLSHRFKKL